MGFENGWNMDKIRVIAVDDHEVVLDGLCSLLNRQEDFEVVGTAKDGREAVDLTDRLHPDVVVMDVSMPGLNGVLATKQISAQGHQARVLAYSVHDSAEIVRQALENGARGYVSKASAVAELPRAIRAVASGEVFLSSDIRVAPRRTTSTPAQARQLLAVDGHPGFGYSYRYHTPPREANQAEQGAGHGRRSGSPRIHRRWEA